MTFDEFIKKWNGKGIDFDGAYGDQCMDLMHQYCVEVLGLSDGRILAASAAKDVYLNFANIFGNQYFDQIKNTPTGIPQKGDIILWGTGLGPDGHVAIFVGGDANKFKSFDQNFPIGSKCHLQDHNYTGLLGWLHPKNSNPEIDLQAELDKTRQERDTNWNLYQECLGKEADYQKQINDLQNANITLNAKIAAMGKAIKEDAIEDSDTGKQLLEATAKLQDAQKDLDFIAYTVGVAPYDFQRTLAGIEALKIPTEEAVKPVLKERNELYRLFFEQGLALYKRFRPPEGFLTKIINWILRR